MSDVGARLASFFVAPPARAPAFGPPSAPGPVPPARVPPPTPGPGPWRRSAPPFPAVAVVGGAEAAAFAVDLTAALATRCRRRSALTVVWGTPATPPRGQATWAAIEAHAALGPGAGTVGGRVVVAPLPEGIDDALDAWRDLINGQEDAGAPVLALCGPRPSTFDRLLRAQEHLVLALAPGHPDGLEALAVASLTQAAPAARVTSVTVSATGAIPRPLRHRAAIRTVLGALA